MSKVNVKVVLRVRPLNQKEIERGGQICVNFVNQQTVKIKFSEEQEGAKSAETIPDFNFDHVFSMDTSQKQIFEIAAKPVIESVFEGFNGTIFAYGQTSSGKTHTMQGPNISDDLQKGIIPRMVDHIFQKIYDSPDHIEFKIKISAVEIYMEKIRDLLGEGSGSQNLQIREDKAKGIYIQGCQESYVSDEKDIYDLLQLANVNRAVAHTNMNSGSSRSHMVFILNITKTNTQDNSCVIGKLSLIDLAGSEKIEKTGAQGQTLEEAKLINKSLSELGNVINALTDKNQQHIPYRNSKLTRLLQESLGGNARTTLIITASPSPYNELETLSTLRFGTRAKSIENKAIVNKEWTVNELLQVVKKKDAEIADLKKRNQTLEQFIEQKGLEVPADMTLEEKKEKQQVQEEADLEALYSNISDLKDQTKSLEEELNSERQINIQKDEEIQKLTQQIKANDDEAEKKILDYQQQQIQLNQELLDEQDEADTLRSKTQILENDIEQLKIELEKAQQESQQLMEDNIKQEMEEIHQQKMNQKIEEIEIEKHAIQNKLNEAQNESQEKSKELEEKETKMKETAQEMEKLKNQLDILLKSENGEKLENIRQEFQQQNQELQTQLLKKGEQLEKMFNYMQEQQKSQQQLTSSNSNNNEELKQLIQEQFKIQKEKEDQKNLEAEKIQKRLEESEEKNASLKEQIEKNQKQYENDIDSMIRQKLKLETEVNELKSQVKDSKKNKKGNFKALEAQITTFAQQMQQQISQNKQQQIEIEILSTKYNRAREHIKNMEKQHSATQQKQDDRYKKLVDKYNEEKKAFQNNKGNNQQLINQIQEKYKNLQNSLQSSKIVKPIKGKKHSNVQNQENDQQLDEQE